MKKVILILSLLLSTQALAIGQVAICGSENGPIGFFLVGGVFNSDGKFPVRGHVTVPSGEILNFVEVQVVTRENGFPGRIQILKPQDSGVEFSYNSRTNQLTAILTNANKELGTVFCQRMDM